MWDDCICDSYLDSEGRTPIVERCIDLSKSFSPIRAVFSNIGLQTFPHAMPPLHILRDAVDVELVQPLQQCLATWRCGRDPTNSVLSAAISDVLQPRLLDTPPVVEWLQRGRIEHLVLSRPEAVTLDAISRKEAGIAEQAAYFCICYGAVDSAGERVVSLDLPHGVCPNLAKLFDRGGYVYFDEHSHVAQVNVFIPYAEDYNPSQVQTLHFGLPRKVPDTLRLELESSGRLVSTTLPHLVEGGGTHYAWLVPGEHPHGPHGGFAYKLNRDARFPAVDGSDQHSNWVFFAVHEA
jgi:hypothetical protein